MNRRQFIATSALATAGAAVGRGATEPEKPRIKLGISATETGDWTVLEDDPFRPLAPISIKLQVDDAGLPETLLNGYVSSLDATWGEGPGASKLTKAEELGVPILDEAQFVTLLETGELPSP